MSNEKENAIAVTTEMFVKMNEHQKERVALWADGYMAGRQTTYDELVKRTQFSQKTA